MSGKLLAMRHLLLNALPDSVFGHLGEVKEKRWVIPELYL